MTQYLPIILASAVLAFLVTPATRWLARRVNMVDQPGIRKAHRSPTPLLGGLALYLAVTVVFIFFGQRDWVTEGVGILGGATLMLATGLWDDRFGMPAWLKFGAALVAALFLSAFGVRVQLFDVLWADVLITVLWVVGITNAANLMDNMDGLAAGLAAVAAIIFFVLAALEGQGFVASLAAALLGAALGFLFYNFAPAVSFMGDAGSLTLGFLLAALGIKIRFLQLPLGATWMAPILVLGIFIFDTTLVTLSRVRRGRSPFQGGSDHTSHRLAQLGLSKPRAVLTLYVAALALGALAIVVTRLPVLTANLIFAALVALGVIALLAFERIDPALSGDPPIVLIPGGGRCLEALQAVSRVSGNVTILVDTQSGARLSRAEIEDILTAVSEDQAAARFVLQRTLSDQWWSELPVLQRALRLQNNIVAITAANVTEAVIALRAARAIVVGPGEMTTNVEPLLARPEIRAALEVSRERLVWAGESLPDIHWRLNQVAPHALVAEVQRLVLHQAAGHIKSMQPSP